MNKLFVGDFFDPIACRKHPSSFGMFDMAIEHFEEYGYQLIEVPWKVSKKALKITCPVNQKVNTSGFVASGEQSFLELILQGVLPNGKYQCLTPCYRPNDKFDKWHFTQFYKLELIEYFGESTSWDVADIFSTMRCVSNFIKNFTEIEPLFVSVEDEPRICETIMPTDIMLNEIEYGSYGLRRHDGIGCWLYATGLALPRFQQILEMK